MKFVKGCKQGGEARCVAVAEIPKNTGIWSATGWGWRCQSGAAFCRKWLAFIYCKLFAFYADIFGMKLLRVSFCCFVWVSFCWLATAHDLGHSKLSKPVAPHVHDSVQPLPEELQRKLEDTGIIFVETVQTGVELLGYVDASYTFSSRCGGSSSESGQGDNPITHEDSQDFNAYGLHMHLSKPLPGENTWAAGFTIGLQFGESHLHTHSHGHGHDEDSHARGEFLGPLEEAYVEFRVPVGNGWDFGFGTWMTFFGYEPHDRPANNHVTQGVVRHFLEPFTHTGIFARYPLSDQVTLRWGLTNGWDHADSSFFDGADFSKNILGSIEVVNAVRNARLELGFSYSPDGEERFSKAGLGKFDFGHHHDEETFHEDGNVWAFNINGTWYPASLRDRLMLGFNATVVHTDDNLRARVVQDHGHGDPELVPWRARNTATMWGAALYARYQLSEVFSLAGRLEYLHADDSTLGFHDGWVKKPRKKEASLDKQGMLHTQTDLISWTLTASYTPVESLLLRAEYRLDHISARGGKDHDTLLGSGSNLDHSFSLYAAYLLW
jgi:hypothetical protein